MFQTCFWSRIKHFPRQAPPSHTKQAIWLKADVLVGEVLRLHSRPSGIQLRGTELVSFLAYISLCSQAHTYCDNFRCLLFYPWYLSSASTPLEAYAQCFNFLFLREGWFLISILNYVSNRSSWDSLRSRSPLTILFLEEMKLWVPRNNF